MLRVRSSDPTATRARRYMMWWSAETSAETALCTAQSAIPLLAEMETVMTFRIYSTSRKMLIHPAYHRAEENTSYFSRSQGDSKGFSREPSGSPVPTFAPGVCLSRPFQSLSKLFLAAQMKPCKALYVYI